MLRWIKAIIAGLIAGGLLLSAGVVCASTSVPVQTGIAPYRVITPAIDEDSRIVRLYFQYTCPYCRAAHQQLVRWGKSLPKYLEFKESPIVGMTAATMMPAFGYYAVRKIAPARLAAYNEQVYAQIQDAGKSPTDIGVYAIAAKKAGIPEAAFISAWESDEVKQIVGEAARLTGRYGLLATPSIAAGGKMVITPEITSGVNQNFITLANAVTSKLISEMASDRGEVK